MPRNIYFHRYYYSPPHSAVAILADIFHNATFYAITPLNFSLSLLLLRFLDNYPVRWSIIFLVFLVFLPLILIVLSLVINFCRAIHHHCVGHHFRSIPTPCLSIPFFSPNRLYLTGYMIVYGKMVLYDKTRFSWGFESTSFKCVYQVLYMKRTLRTVYSIRKQCCSRWKIALRLNHVNKESKSLELTI